jgi:hypothetical protein
LYELEERKKREERAQEEEEVRLEWVQCEEATRRRAESGGGFEGKNQLRSVWLLAVEN